MKRSLLGVADAAGHLGIWAGLYVAAAVVFMVQCAGRSDLLFTARGGLALACAFFTAMGVYLLDRVKVADRWLDPAGQESKPARHAFLRPHAPAFRTLAAALGLAGAASAWRVRPAAAALVPLAYAGIVLYAGRPHGARRPKDWFIIKNLCVAAAISAFAGSLLLFLSASAPAAGAIVGGILLLGRVTADAVLCDIDDAEADRRFGTRTIPARIGRDRTWTLVLLLNLLLAAASWLPPARGLWPIRLFWSFAALLTGMGLRLVNPRQIRDLVDVRFAVIGAAAAALSAFGLLSADSEPLPGISSPSAGIVR